jgi:hypothetical protein
MPPRAPQTSSTWDQGRAQQHQGTHMRSAWSIRVPWRFRHCSMCSFCGCTIQTTDTNTTASAKGHRETRGGEAAQDAARLPQIPGDNCRCSRHCTQARQLMQQQVKQCKDSVQTTPHDGSGRGCRSKVVHTVQTIATGGLRVWGQRYGACKQDKRTVRSPCATNAGEIYGSGRTRAKQERGGASSVRATQHDADGSRHALLCKYQGRMRKHKQTVTHLWLIKPLQRRLRIMR